MKALSLSIPGANGEPIELPSVGNMPQGGVGALTNIVQVGLNLLIIAALILSLFYLIWGGFNWLMSEGDKQRVNNAKQKIVYAVLGLIVVFASFFVINVIYGFFFGGNVSPLNYKP
jgi:TRAP-type C4-dicarboxylate transport system permease small subunit